MSEPVPLKKTETVFVNVYREFHDSRGVAYSTRKIADQLARKDRLACIEVEYTEGEGLTDVGS